MIFRNTYLSLFCLFLCYHQANSQTVDDYSQENALGFFQLPLERQREILSKVAPPEIAERDGLKRIAERHVRRAQHKIELDRVTEVVRTLPTQSKLVLISIIVGERIQDNITPLTTGEVYSIYKELASSVSIDHLTQRRITDLVSELDMLGIVTARVISKGRYGRTRHIRMSTSIDKTIEVLDEDDLLRGLARYRPKIQTRLL